MSFAVRLAAGGCGEGWLRLRAWHAPFEIDRIDANGTAREQYDMEEAYATLSQTLWVWLSRPSEATAEFTATSMRRTPTTVVTTTVRTASTVHEVVETTTVNTTNATCAAAAACSEIATSTTRRPPALLLQLLRAPPPRLSVREPFNVTLQLVTDQGLAVPGEAVTAVLVATRGSRGRLRPGATAVTDANGTATLRLTVSAGASGNYTLLFLSDAIVRPLQTDADAVLALAKSRSRQAEASVRALLAEELGSPEVQAELAAAVQAYAEADASRRATAAAQQAAGCASIGTPAARQQCAEQAAGEQQEQLGGFTVSAELQTALFGVLSRVATNALSDVLPVRLAPPADEEEAAALALELATKLFEQLPVPSPRTFWLANDVSPELTAPISGFGASLSTRTPFNRWTSWKADLSDCATFGYARYVPSPMTKWYTSFDATMLLPPTAAFRYSEEFDVAMWQPWPFNLLNFVMDRNWQTGESIQLFSEYCAGGDTSFITSGVELPAPKLAPGCADRIGALRQAIANGTAASLDRDAAWARARRGRSSPTMGPTRTRWRACCGTAASKGSSDSSKLRASSSTLQTAPSTMTRSTTVAMRGGWRTTAQPATCGGGLRRLRRAAVGGRLLDLVAAARRPPLAASSPAPTWCEQLGGSSPGRSSRRSG